MIAALTIAWLLATAASLACVYQGARAEARFNAERGRE